MSASAKIGGLGLLLPISAAAAGSAGYAAYKIDWKVAAKQFFTGPGRTSRILLLLLVLVNRKGLPFVWTWRVFYSIFYHNFIRPAPKMKPNALFKPLITTSHAPLLEIDYNLHKSNSTYFSDLDVARSHLVSHLCHRPLRSLSRNPQTKLVLDPRTNKPASGPLGIMLGSVACSFKKEIPAYKGYEMWTRVLSWDRKWLYMVTHFVPKGCAKPTSWLDPGFAKKKVRGSQDAAGGWDNKIYASAVSKYVFKVGRLTVHPAVVLEEGGLLPERPGGWTSGDDQLGEPVDEEEFEGIALDRDGEWDWRRVELARRTGMELAQGFAELDNLHGKFDGGNQGAVATFSG